MLLALEYGRTGLPASALVSCLPRSATPPPLLVALRELLNDLVAPKGAGPRRGSCRGRALWSPGPRRTPMKSYTTTSPLTASVLRWLPPPPPPSTSNVRSEEDLLPRLSLPLQQPVSRHYWVQMIPGTIQSTIQSRVKFPDQRARFVMQTRHKNKSRAPDIQHSASTYTLNQANYTFSVQKRLFYCIPVLCNYSVNCFEHSTGKRSTNLRNNYQ